jgi:hypothetical protein
VALALEEHRRQPRQEAPEGCYAELKEELQELKKKVCGVADEMWKLKQQLVEVHGVYTKKCHVVLDCSVLLVVGCGILGVVGGVLLSHLFN